MLFFPIVLTVIIWTAVLKWPLRPRRAPHDFGPELEATGRIITGFLVSALLWLVVLVAS